MNRQGKWLFRWRSYLPIIFFVVFIPALLDHRHPFGSHRFDQLWEGACLVLGFFGLFIRILTVGYAPRNTSGRNTKEQIAESLNTVVSPGNWTGIFLMKRLPKIEELVEFHRRSNRCPRNVKLTRHRFERRWPWQLIEATRRSTSWQPNLVFRRNRLRIGSRV